MLLLKKPTSGLVPAVLLFLDWLGILYCLFSLAFVEKDYKAVGSYCSVLQTVRCGRGFCSFFLFSKEKQAVWYRLLLIEIWLAGHCFLTFDSIFLVVVLIFNVNLRFRLKWLEHGRHTSNFSCGLERESSKFAENVRHCNNGLSLAQAPTTRFYCYYSVKCLYLVNLVYR